jgi:ABC-type branched-subunit amino acid transport system substrate-binding protein
VRRLKHADGVNRERGVGLDHRRGRGGQRRRGTVFAMSLVTSLAIVAGMIVAPGAGATVGRQVRGFDGTTIKVGGLGNQSTLGSAETGAEARIMRFNDDNEIKGVTIDYVGFADDKSDPATALSEGRRLVTQEQVFAIVGDASSFNPKDFFTQNKVPFFGWGTEGAYCAPKPTTELWGFGYNGCQNNPEPTVAVDSGKLLYKYTVEQIGKKKPTIAIISNDSAFGKSTTKSHATSYAGAGFEVVDAQANVPLAGSVGDFTPYAQQLLTADNGEAPDVMRCLMGTECLSIYGLVKAAGYEGNFNHSLLTDILVKPFEGSTAGQTNANYATPGIPALEQMKADVEAFKPGQKIDSPLTSGYASTDMFIKALKKAAKGGTSKITPEAVQQAAARQTWEMKGFTGPIKYPDSAQHMKPYCFSISKSDGTQWVTVEPFSCSTRLFKVKQ